MWCLLIDLKFLVGSCWFLDFERFVSKVVTCSPGVDMKTRHWAFQLPVTLGEDVCGSNCP